MKIDINLDDNVFWLSVWSVVTTGIVIIATLVHHASLDEDREIAKLILAGHDPMSLACVYKVSESNRAPCLILSQTRPQEMSNAKNTAKK